MEDPKSPHKPQKRRRSVLVQNNESVVLETPVRKLMQGMPLSNYKLGECIGRGASGSVYKAMNYNTGEVVAIKQINISDSKDGDLKMLMAEIDVSKELDHPNIVKYHGFEKAKDTLNIILEFCENGSLRNILTKFGKFPERLVASYMYQILKGLEYLHRQGTIHRDIKGANILTTKDGTAKLADFGVATQVRPNQQTIVGTPYWMAPEVILGSGATYKSDIWSLGCTVIELITGNPPFYERETMPAMYAIVNEESTIPEEVTPSLNDFLLSCLSKDPLLRKDATELLEHPWIQQIVTGQQPHTPKRALTNFDNTVKKVQEYNNSVQEEEIMPSSTSRDSSAYNDSESELPLEKHATTPSKGPIDSSKYAENEEDDFSDLVGEPNIQKAISLGEYIPRKHRKSDNGQKVSGPQSTDEALPRVDLTHTKSKSVDINQFMEVDDEWEDDLIMGLQQGLKLKPRVPTDTDVSGFMDQLLNLDDVQDAKAREITVRETKKMEKYARRLVSATSVPTEEQTTALILNALKVYPETGTALLKSHGLLSLRRVIHNRVSPLLVENVLKIVRELCNLDQKILFQICSMGMLRDIIKCFSKKHNSTIRYLAERFIQLVCQEKGGVDMFCSNSGITMLPALIFEDFQSQGQIVMEAVNILWLVLNHQPSDCRSISCEILLDCGIPERLAKLLYLTSKEEDKHEKLVNNLLFFSDTAVSKNNRQCFYWIFQCRSLSESDQIHILKFLKNQSFLSSNHQLLQESRALPYLSGILENAKTSDKFQIIALQVLQIMINLCQLNPKGQEELISTGTIPLLQDISAKKEQTRDLSMQILVNLARSTPRVRSLLWRYDMLSTYVKFTDDTSWQVMAFGAIDEWLQTDMSGVQNQLVSEAMQNKLLEGLAGAGSNTSKLLEIFYQLICHGPKLCSVVSTNPKLHSLLRKRLKLRDPTETRTILQILGEMLENNPNRVKELCRYKYESVLMKIVHERDLVVVQKMAKKILSKMDKYLGSLVKSH